MRIGTAFWIFGLLGLGLVASYHGYDTHGWTWMVLGIILLAWGFIDLGIVLREELAP